MLGIGSVLAEPPPPIEARLYFYVLVDAEGAPIRISDNLDVVTSLGMRIGKTGWKVLRVRAMVTWTETLMEQEAPGGSTIPTGGATVAPAKKEE